VLRVDAVQHATVRAAAGCVRGPGDLLDGSLLPKLRAFLATREERGAVEVDGKKMAASFRFAFPGEPVWSKAFRDAAQRAAPARARSRK